MRSSNYNKHTDKVLFFPLFITPIFHSPDYERAKYCDDSARADEDAVSLSESAFRQDGTFPVRIIAEGWGSSGVSIPIGFSLVL